MLNGVYVGKRTSYDGLVHDLLYTENPLGDTANYLADNYGQKAVPVLMKALPIRPDVEGAIILDVLGKLGDIRAIVPICNYLQTNGRWNSDSDRAPTEIGSVAARSLNRVLHHTAQRKKAVSLLVDVVAKYRVCIGPVVNVLRQQRDEYTLKLVYRRLFRQDNHQLKDAAVRIIGLEDGIIDRRLYYLKKIIARLEEGELKSQAEAAFEILRMKKRCQNLCALKGMEYSACYLRDDNRSFDCCGIDKTGRRVLMEFKGSRLS